MSEIITRTFKELKEIDSIVGSLYGKNKSLKESKFGYAYKRFAEKNLIPTVKEFNDELESIRIQEALEDPTTKEILVDRMSNRGYKYSKSGLLSVTKKENDLEKLYNEKIIEIIPFISAFKPEEISIEQEEILTGLLL